MVKDLGASLEKLFGLVGSRKRSADEAGITEPSLWSCAVSTWLCLKKHEKALKDIATSVEKLILDVSKLFAMLVIKSLTLIIMEDNEDNDIENNLFGNNFFQNPGKCTIIGGILSGSGYASGAELEGI